MTTGTTEPADPTAALIERILVDKNCRLAGIQYASAGGITEYRLTVAHIGPPYHAYALSANTLSAALRKAEAWASQHTREAGKIAPGGVGDVVAGTEKGRAETMEKKHEFEKALTAFAEMLEEWRRERETPTNDYSREADVRWRDFRHALAEDVWDDEIHQFIMNYPRTRDK